MTDFRGKIACKCTSARVPLMITDQVTVSTCTDNAYFTSDNIFANMLLSNITINVSEISNSDTKHRNIKSQKTKQVDSENLANHWNTDLGKAKKTTTQRTKHGFLSCLHPTLGYQYPTNDQMLHYKRMPDPVYYDTIKSVIVSKLGNKYGQAYCTSYGWSHFHPMAQKSEAHVTMSLMFKRNGVLPKITVDKSKEQPLRVFERRCIEAEYHLVNSKQYSPWTQMAEGCIRELKRGLSRQLIKNG